MAAGAKTARLGRPLGYGRVYDALFGVGGAGALATRIVRIAARPPFTWLPDAIVEAATTIRRTAVPLAISVVVFMLSFALFVTGELLKLLGATDRFGGGVYVGITRELGFWLTAMVVAGVAGSAMTAELGARRIREELDALAVLGVDSVRSLVVPRVVAMTVMMPALGLFTVLASQVVLYASAPAFLHFPYAAYRDSVTHSVQVVDLYSALLKNVVVGFFIGVVACHKGLTCKRGAEGVGRAVNQSVVITFFGIWLLNGLWNLAFLALFPAASITRG